jgi:protein-L-isoaspartate(D-aspartate) O-methyltransferase
MKQRLPLEGNVRTASRHHLILGTVAAVVLVGGMVVTLLAGNGSTEPQPQDKASTAATVAESRKDDDADKWRPAREQMVAEQIEVRGISDPRVLKAMREEPRHLYVPERLQARAYGDHPLPIQNNQTISQPYIVARMTDSLELKPGHKVLEIGTGSGYQAAILSRMGMKTFSIEIVEPLCRSSRAILDRLGHEGVRTRCGDGYEGWPEEAPFDAILVTAAPEHVPPRLIEQLAPGGRLVIPVGGGQQWLVRLRKEADGTIRREVLDPVRFVPMTGKARDPTVR